LERQLEVLDQNGEGALRHSPVTDEQNFVPEFQHAKVVLARHFVRKFFAIQEFIQKMADGAQLATHTKLAAGSRHHWPAGKRAATPWRQPSWLPVNAASSRVILFAWY
jgi:hypothetical protein